MSEEKPKAVDGLTALVSMVVYMGCAGQIAGAWSNPTGLALWLGTFVGLLGLLPKDAHGVARAFVAAWFLAVPWLAGFWR